MLSILVVEDHALFREALRGVVQALGATEVIEARDFAQACARLAQEPPIDLLLLDLRLPDRCGLGTVRELRSLHPALPLVVISADEDPQSMREALDMGVMGYIPKSASREVMLRALALVLAGEIFVPRHALDATPAGGPAQAAPHPPLSPRQWSIARLLAEGCPNREIARRLDIAEATVKAHLTRIFQILGVENRAQAALAAQALLASRDMEPPPAAQRSQA